MTPPDARQVAEQINDALTDDELIAILESALSEARRQESEEAAAKLDEIAAGPFTGDGIIGPLQVIGLQQGFKWAANLLRQRARPSEQTETPQ